MNYICNGNANSKRCCRSQIQPLNLDVGNESAGSFYRKVAVTRAPSAMSHLIHYYYNPKGIKFCTGREAWAFGPHTRPL